MQNYQRPRRQGIIPEKPSEQPLDVAKLAGVLVGVLLICLGFLGLCYCVFLYLHQ